MVDLSRAISRIDAFQRRHRGPAFVVAVLKKFGDDQGGNLSALITYYGFVSLFPLLLVFVTVLGYVLQGNPTLQHDLVNSAVADFPIIGDQITKNVRSIQGSGLALLIGVLGALYGGLGIANAAQDAMNRVWEVPMRARPGFGPRLARSLTIVAVLGVGIIATTLLGGIGGGGSGLALWERSLVLLAGFLVNIALFAWAYRVLTASDLGWGVVAPGAVIAAAGWGVMQAIGGTLVSHQLRGASALYGVFAIVLGLLAWIFIQARIFVYAAEVNAVRANHLWPRSLAAPPFTDADRRAYRSYTRVEERVHPPAELS
jgi:inner membrane protein YhjD